MSDYTVGVLVKGMKMPRFCAECALKYTCEESNLLLGNKRRATDCPLEEVKEQEHERGKI